ncbi:MAG TPA: GntR family transcriptional regulator [Solirubrobacteraceae bacterium]|nr:GntR family transcriptional regulator [Solirubrobacteraceae bacterium]
MTWNGIALDPHAAVPLGVQLDWAIRAAIADGRLQPGDRLPALRALAEDLGVNHNTLRAAVAKLEAEGLLESRHGTGTFVAATASGRAEQAPLVERIVRWAGDAGLSPRDLAAALYVADVAGPSEPDAAAEERRALREEIAVLDRLVVQLEDRLPHHLPPEPRRARGSRLLGTGELREERDALVRRLAAVQRALEPAEEEHAAERAPAPRRAPGLAPRGVRPAHGA